MKGSQNFGEYLKTLGKEDEDGQTTDPRYRNSARNSRELKNSNTYFQRQLRDYIIHKAKGNY